MTTAHQLQEPIMTIEDALHQESLAAYELTVNNLRADLAAADARHREELDAYALTVSNLRNELASAKFCAADWRAACSDEGRKHKAADAHVACFQLALICAIREVDSLCMEYPGQHVDSPEMSAARRIADMQVATTAED